MKKILYLLILNSIAFSVTGCATVDLEADEHGTTGASEAIEEPDESVLDSGVDSDTIVGPDTAIDSESDQGIDTDTNTSSVADTDTNPDTSVATDIDTVTDTVTVIDTVTDTDTGTDTGTDTDTDTGTGNIVDTDSDTGSDTGTSKDTDTDTGAVTKNCGDGVFHFGTCWYKGKANQSCNDVCADKGGYDPVTPNYVGTPEQGGSYEECVELFKALGYGDYSVIPIVRVDFGFGCYEWGYGGVYALYYLIRTSQEFSPSYKSPNALIVCGCKGL
jgi:hypothetical protein